MVYCGMWGDQSCWSLFFVVWPTQTAGRSLNRRRISLSLFDGPCLAKSLDFGLHRNV